MHQDDIKNSVAQCFEDEGFIARLREKLLAPIISQCVAEALQTRDREIEQLRAQLSAAQNDVDSLEQYSRRNSLMITGLPESARESTDALVIDLAKAAGVTVTVADLDRSHRVGPPRRDRPRQIIAKFVAFNKRQELLEARTNLRAGRVQQHPILTQQVLANTYIAENLTKRNQLILFVARQLRRKGKLHSAWTNNCVIKVRTREGGPTTKINSLTGLRDVVGDDPDIRSALQQTGVAAAPAPGAGRAPIARVPEPAAARRPAEGDAAVTGSVSPAPVPVSAAARSPVAAAVQPDVPVAGAGAAAAPAASEMIETSAQPSVSEVSAEAAPATVGEPGAATDAVESSEETSTESPELEASPASPAPESMGTPSTSLSDAAEPSQPVTDDVRLLPLSGVPGAFRMIASGERPKKKAIYEDDDVSKLSSLRSSNAQSEDGCADRRRSSRPVWEEEEEQEEEEEFLDEDYYDYCPEQESVLYSDRGEPIPDLEPSAGGRTDTVSDQYGGALCLDDDARSDTSEGSRAKLTQMKSEAAQRLDDLEKLIGEHQEIVQELKRTESSQGSLVDLVDRPSSSAAETDRDAPETDRDAPETDRDASSETAAHQPAAPEDPEESAPQHAAAAGDQEPSPDRE
ncbi:hypothetical protein FJT64_014026 [Amphibalanus amphitrite]|uniref:Uncharacterized protein n=1 Tax=Amphibalanus amphitrite TaxID=1232801 RepID=A0A6A4VD81_AMPAM|nr:hypothetical protein FJT64_014026 [Amphibalanus amphitrite]